MSIFVHQKNEPFPLCEERGGFSSQLCRLSLRANICGDLLQHGGLRGAEGNLWNHLPEIPPVCIQLHVLGESPLCRVWVLLQRRLSLRGQAVMTAWSVSQHRWHRKKMRRNHFIFKQSKIGIIGWNLLLFWLVESQKNYTATHLKAKSSELSSNEHMVFWECRTTNNCHIWMRCIKWFQARHWFRVWNHTLPICDNHLSARQSDVSNWQTLLGLSVPESGVTTMWMFYYWTGSVFPHTLMLL